MNDLADKRRKILASLIADGVSLADVARMFGKPDRQIKDMIAEPPRKTFGDKVARQMESYAIEHGYKNIHQYFFDGLQKAQGSFGSSFSVVNESKEAVSIASAITKKYRQAITIEHYDAEGAMGQGIILKDQSGVICEWEVSEEWVRLNIKNYTSIENLKIVTGFGDSMQGMFNSGDPLIIDIGVKIADRDSPYFFRVGNEGFIKRLQRVPGVGLRAISANKEYESWTITEDMDFEIFGIVLKSWQSNNYN